MICHRNLTLTYIDEPAVKLISLDIVFLKVTEPIHFKRGLTVKKLKLKKVKDI